MKQIQKPVIDGFYVTRAVISHDVIDFAKRFLTWFSIDTVNSSNGFSRVSVIKG